MAERATELDADVPSYATGPGRRQVTTGPVVEVYADGAIDRPCHVERGGCGAEPLDYCRWPTGQLRKLPCRNR